MSTTKASTFVRSMCLVVVTPKNKQTKEEIPKQQQQQQQQQQQRNKSSPKKFETKSSIFVGKFNDTGKISHRDLMMVLILNGTKLRLKGGEWI
jgi:hypothetical protein